MPDDAFTKRYFAKVYGFTEEQTDNASLDAITWWPLMEEAEQHAAEVHQKQEEARQRRNAR
jgi:hypothetical protein